VSHPGPPRSTDGWFSRERVLALTLLGATVLVFYVCYLLVQPFLPALAWALALAVIAYRLLLDRRRASRCSARRG